MDDSWIIALFGAVVGSLITILTQIIYEKIKVKCLREQMLKHLYLEVSTFKTKLKTVDDLDYSSIPTVISRHLLLTNILDPIKDKELIEKITQYILCARDIDKSLFVEKIPLDKMGAVTEEIKMLTTIKRGWFT